MFLGLDANDHTGTGLNDCNRNQDSLLVIDLRHANFLSDQTFHNAPFRHMSSRKKGPWCQKMPLYGQTDLAISFQS